MPSRARGQVVGVHRARDGKECGGGSLARCPIMGILAFLGCAFLCMISLRNSSTQLTLLTHLSTYT